MQIELLNIGSLIPYAFNNVDHPESQIDRIANSIKEFGWTVPILASKDNVVIAGHGRLLAAKKLGLAEVPVIRAEGMTEAQQRAYRILDNKLTRDSEWNFANIEVDFSVMKDEGFDFSAWGLDSLMPVAVEGQVFDEDVADGVVLEAKFKISIPVEDSDSFEQRLDELLRQFPEAKKEKAI
jgi:hypothetical protein